MKLSSEWIEYLRNQPESGMGYQKVTIILKDGSKYEDVAILNCSSIVSIDRDIGNCPFSEEQIDKILVEDVKKQEK